MFKTTSTFNIINQKAGSAYYTRVTYLLKRVVLKLERLVTSVINSQGNNLKSLQVHAESVYGTFSHNSYCMLIK